MKPNRRNRHKSKSRSHESASTQRRPRRRSRDDSGVRAAFKALAALDAIYRDRRTKYEQFLAGNRSRPPLDRAVAWLQFVASDPDNYGDQEALVYLAVRGLDVGELISATVERWKQDEEDAIAASIRGTPIHNAATGKTTYTNALSASEASDVEHASEFLLREFWQGHRSQAYSLDATMLRTVEWCGIGGFDRWWRRLVRITRENLVWGGVEPDSAIFYLFNMARSNYALELMAPELDRMLQAVELPRASDPPWVSARPFRGREGRPEYHRVEDIGYASALVFAGHRIRAARARTPLIDEAVALVQRAQHARGSWPIWFSSTSAGIQETAMATHALAALRPRGWERQAKKAASWLLAQQDDGGYWQEDTCPDPTYLTVLVLDAITLASGGTQVTFGRPSVVPSEPLATAKKKRRFRVAVSFPGEERITVERIVRLLQAQLGPGTVFYDNDFRGELARPDLDLYLQLIYHDETELVVVFVGPRYHEKEWCGLEWRAIRDLIKIRRTNDVMLLRMAHATLPPGMLSVDGVIDISNLNDQEVVGMIQQRLQLLSRG